MRDVVPQSLGLIVRRRVADLVHHASRLARSVADVIQSALGSRNSGKTSGGFTAGRKFRSGGLYRSILSIFDGFHRLLHPDSTDRGGSHPSIMAYGWASQELEGFNKSTNIDR